MTPKCSLEKSSSDRFSREYRPPSPCAGMTRSKLPGSISSSSSGSSMSSSKAPFVCRAGRDVSLVWYVDTVALDCMERGYVDGVLVSMVSESSSSSGSEEVDGPRSASIAVMSVLAVPLICQYMVQIQQGVRSDAGVLTLASPGLL